MPTDPAAAVRAMRLCRNAMLTVCKDVKPMGPAYHGASMVIAAIDAFAIFLTGERYYFTSGGSVMSEGQRKELEDQRARENGDKPWQA